MSVTHRVNVNFSEGAYATLVDLADRHGKTKAEVLRDAISLARWIEDERRAGARFLVSDGDGGNVREAVFR
jgi:hypothetical protein